VTMTPGLATLERAIDAHLAEWERPYVELAIHGSAEPRVIALALDAFCRRELNAPVVEAFFYRSSIGAVAGVALMDGRRVVIKAHQPNRVTAQLRDVLKLQRHLAANTGIAPHVIAGPLPLGSGLATVEEFRSDGEIRDGHEPTIRRALASGLHRVIRELETFADRVELRSIDPPGDSLWPVPHSRLFDFASTAEGAGYIDELAREARRRMQSAGPHVISHNDWRAEHVRFQADAISVAYDWDSLCVTHEPAAVGAAAHMFCADWSREDVVQAPTLEEARAFVDDYEAVRGGSFTPEERRACGASFTYAVAYTARCGHASGVDLRNQRGNHQHLVASHGMDLLALWRRARRALSPYAANQECPHYAATTFSLSAIV
jgi:hypothetical protein